MQYLSRQVINLDSLFIFFYDSKINLSKHISDNTLLAGNTVEQQPFAPQYMIPCPTTDPTVNVTLYRVKDDNVSHTF